MVTEDSGRSVAEDKVEDKIHFSFPGSQRNTSRNLDVIPEPVEATKVFKQSLKQNYALVDVKKNVKGRPATKEERGAIL